MLLVQEIAQYLDDNSIGTYSPSSVDGNIFINFAPIEPDNIINITNYGGQPSQASKGCNACKFDIALIQLYVRGEREDALTPLQKAQDIYNLMVGLHQTTLVDGGKYILNILAVQGSPVFIGRDNNLRFEYTINLRVEFNNINKQY